MQRTIFFSGNAKNCWTQEVGILKRPQRSTLHNIKGVPSAESSRSVRGLGKGVSGKPYPRLCNARRPWLEPGTFRSQAVRLPLAPGPPFSTLHNMIKFKWMLRPLWYICVYWPNLCTGNLLCQFIHLDKASCVNKFRYQKLLDICIKEQIGILLIAHHSDDQVC